MSTTLQEFLVSIKYVSDPTSQNQAQQQVNNTGKNLLKVGAAALGVGKILKDQLQDYVKRQVELGAVTQRTGITSVSAFKSMSTAIRAAGGDADSLISSIEGVANATRGNWQGMLGLRKAAGVKDASEFDDSQTRTLKDLTAMRQNIVAAQSKLSTDPHAVLKAEQLNTQFFGSLGYTPDVMRAAEKDDTYAKTYTQSQKDQQGNQLNARVTDSRAVQLGADRVQNVTESLVSQSTVLKGTLDVAASTLNSTASAMKDNLNPNLALVGATAVSASTSLLALAGAMWAVFGSSSAVGAATAATSGLGAAFGRLGVAMAPLLSLASSIIGIVGGVAILNGGLEEKHKLRIAKEEAEADPRNDVKREKYEQLKKEDIESNKWSNVGSKVWSNLKKGLGMDADKVADSTVGEIKQDVNTVQTDSNITAPVFDVQSKQLESLKNIEIDVNTIADIMERTTGIGGGQSGEAVPHKVGGATGSDSSSGKTPGESGSVPKNGTQVEKAMNYFMSQGWTKNQAAGIVANLNAESGLNPHGKAGDNGTANGIAQWHPDRIAKIENWLGKSWKDTTYEDQLKAVQWELETSHKKAGNALKGQDTISGSTYAVEKNFEVDAYSQRGAVNPVRVKMAEEIANTDLKILDNKKQELGNLSKAVALSTTQSELQKDAVEITDKKNKLAFKFTGGEADLNSKVDAFNKAQAQLQTPAAPVAPINNDNSSTTAVNNYTHNYHLNGVSNPEAAADAITQQQKRYEMERARNVQGSIR